MARRDKALAIELRKSGKSYNFISRELEIPKGTLSDWFKDLKWSTKIKQKNERLAYRRTLERIQKFVKSNKKKWFEWRKNHSLAAVQEYKDFKGKPLFIAGLMLYWSEGDNGLKTYNTRLSNTDPRMIRLFIDFAIKFLKVDVKDIRIALILYPDLDEKICKRFWSRQTKISTNQFYKIQYIKGHHPTKRLNYGICMVRVGGVGPREKIKTWLDLTIRDFVRE